LRVFARRLSEIFGAGSDVEQIVCDLKQQTEMRAVRGDGVELRVACFTDDRAAASSGDD